MDIIMYVYGDLSTDARVQRAANALALDNNVLVVSNTPSRPILNGNYNNFFIERKHKGLIGIFLTILKTIQIVKEKKPNIVYCHDYYSSILAFLLLHTNKHVKLVYDAHELIIPENGISDRRLSFFRWFEKRIVKRVHLLVCANETRGKLMQEYYKLSETPVVIPNVSQLQVKIGEDVDDIINKLSSFFIHPELTIVYAGVVNKGRGVEDLMKAVINLSPKYKLLIVGDGNSREEIEKMAQCTPNLHYAFTGKIPYHTLGALLNKCDIGYVFYSNETLNNRYCASNKIYEYSSVLLPMVANENPTLKKELEDNHIGISSSNITKAIEQVASHLEQYKENCKIFNENNKWSDYAELLQREVSAL